MRLLFINPNTTVSMTTAIEVQARSVAFPGTDVVAVNAPSGPGTIETPRDEVEATREVLQMLPTWQPDTFDGVAIACFGDPGLDLVRARVQVPVVGIAESAILLACAMGRRFSIVAASESAVPMMRDLVARYGLAERLASVRAVGLSVQGLAEDLEGSRGLIEARARDTIEEDGADVVCLGCAAMGRLASEISRSLGRPVIDGVQSAAKMLEALVALNATSQKPAGLSL
jgi:allantoin racemase